MTTLAMTNKTINRFAIRLFAAIFCLGLFAAAEAFAQSGTGPPRPQRADEPPTFIYYGTFAILALLTIGVSIIPSKRGHLD